MAKRDYYEILGIGKNSSQDEIKKAFRNLAKKHHPDVNQGNKEAEEKFKEINEAFQVLSNPQKRTQYDQFGHSAFRPEDFAGFRWPNFDDLFKDFGFNDILNNMFSEFGGRKARTRDGNDLRYDVEISLEDAFNGLTKKIEFPGFVVCNSCDGTGSESGHLDDCKNCDGTGEVRRIHRTGFVQIANIATCNKCGGSGKVATKHCNDCDGNGKIKKTRKIEVKIPKGIDNGQYLRITGEGEVGYNGGYKGDLYVVVNIKDHQIFERNESNLFCKTTIDLATAILGGEIEVPTINGKAKLKIPQGTQSHTIFSLKGQGMHYINSNKKGDQLVKVIVDIPKKISKKQEQLLGEFLSGKKVETSKGFFEKLKEYI